MELPGCQWETKGLQNNGEMKADKKADNDQFKQQVKDCCSVIRCQQSVFSHFEQPFVLQSNTILTNLVTVSRTSYLMVLFM